MRKPILLFILFISYTLYGQSDHEEIRTVLQRYIDGTMYNYPDTILSAFYPGTSMFLYTTTGETRELAIEEYATFFSRKAPGTVNNRPGKIISVDQVMDVAYAKVEVTVPFFGSRFYDLMLLKKFDDGWKIIAKCATAEPIPKRPEEMVSRPEKEVVIDGLKRPWSMAFISETDVLIAEKDGNILRVDLNSNSVEPLTGLPQDLARAITIDTTKVEQGIFPYQAHGQTRSFNAGWFQILLDPDFEENAYIYLSYASENNERASATKIIRGKLEGNKISQIETLFEAAPYVHGLFHYGGGMIFGPDNKLYITLGERHFQEYLNPAIPVAQDITDKRGKIIRINSDGSIPEDNPDFGPDAIKGLYATGIRASQSLAVDPITQKIWFSEHGTIQGDELNILKPGANYGWPYRTSGKYRSRNYQPEVPEKVNFTDPVYFWDQTIAPTGIAFYNGKEFPQWKGDIIVPGLSRGNLWRVTLKEEKVVSIEKLFVNDPVRIRKAIVSPNGQLYILTDEENGKLIRIVNANN